MTKHLERIIKYFVPVLYFAISIMFYLRTYDSCQIKITLIQVCGAVLLALWLIKSVEEFDIEFYKKNIVIVLPIILALISNIFSHLHSPYKYASGMELIRKTIYFGIALLVIKEFDSEEKFSRLIKWLLFACFISTFYGLVQYLDYRFFPPGPRGGLDPFIWRGAFGNRIFSTFGNPNFYGDFLAVMCPIILAIFLKTRRLYLLLLYLLTVFNVAVTYSKGAWIGFVSGFVVFCILAALFLTYMQKGNIKKIVIGIVIMALLISGGAVGYYSMKRTDSIKFRIYTWLSCWEMINTRPVIGTGIGTFYVTYPAFRRPQIFHVEGRHNTETDHPENEYLEVWFDEGLIGFGIFLWVIIMIGLLGYRGLKTFAQKTAVIQTNKKGKNRYVLDDIRPYYMLGFFSSFIGMLSHNFMCVSLRFVSSGIFLWLLVGLIAALCVHNPMPSRTQPRDKSDKTWRFCIIIFWALFFRWLRIPLNIIIPFCAALYIVSEILEYGLKNLSQAPVLPEEKKRNMPVVFKRILQLAIFIVAAFLANYFRGFFVGDAHHNIAIFHSKRGEWSRALENYNIVTEKNPGFIMAHYFMGNVFNDRWINSREFHPEWGDKKTDEPWTMIDSGKDGRVDPERSISKYQDVWKIAPDYVQSFHQAGLLYLKLGGEMKSRGDMAKANEYWKKAINFFEKYHKIDPIFPPNYYRLAWIYTQLGDMKKAEETYLRHIYTMDMFRNGKEEMKWVYEQLGEPVPEDIEECEIHKGKYHSLLREDWGRRRRLEYSETFVNLGNLRFLAKDLPKAEQYYSEALKLNPANINGLKNSAVLYARTGNHDKALSLWQKVRSLNPDDPDVKKVFLNK